MSQPPPRTRQPADRDESDEWLVEAARRAGHPVPRGDRPPGTTAWRMLLNAGIPESEVLALACSASGTESADFSTLSPALAALLPHGLALKYRVVPIAVHNGTLGVATSNPLNPPLERELAFAAKQRVRLHAASPGEILRAQSVVYSTVYGTRADQGAAFAPRTPVASATQPRAAQVTGLAPTAPRVSAPDVAQRAAPPATDLADRLLSMANTERASEAVLEPAADGGILVRLRIDGTLNDRFRIAAAHTARLLQTLKERAGLDVAATGRPQRGRMTFESATGAMAIRIMVDPLADSRERVSLRLFSPAALLGTGELGLSSAEQHRLAQMLGARTGLVIVAGPASSGRTTTLYAAARALRQQGRPVATVEEPIEYALDRVTQVQVSDSPHPTVASAVRAQIVGEGDVLVIGAALDAATLEQLGTEEARARLVLASLPTLDAGATFARLLEALPDRAALAASLQGIVVQRIVRRLCAACAATQPVSDLPEQQQRLLYGLPAARVRGAVGCTTCRTTGYLGRMAIAEVVAMTPQLRSAMAGGATGAELAQVALDGGTATLWQAGMDRVLEGMTSLAELLDTVPPPVSQDAAPQEDIDALLAQLLGSPKMKAESAAPAVASPVAAAPTAAPLRVLLVDDDAVARRALARELGAAGIQVLQAADGVAGVEFAKRLRPDVILTEVAMPRLDAIGLLGALAAERTPFTVVVHTAQADDALVAWLKEAGAKEVLPRDLAAPMLIERLRAVVPALK